MESQTEARAAKLTRASHIKPERVWWLRKYWVPLRTLTLVSGNSGIGKSSVALAIAAELTQGKLPGDLHGTPAHVLIVSPEDDPAAVTVPRLTAAGANLEHVSFFSVTRATESGEVDTAAAFPTDLQLLHRAICESGARLVIIDPIAATIDGDLDRRRDVRAAFDALAALARTLDIAVILVAHNRKSHDSVRNRISGSAAITDAARSVLALAKDDETGHVVMSVDKSSYSGAEGDNHAFEIQECDLQVPGVGTVTTTRAVYLGVSDVSVSELQKRQLSEANGSDDEDDDRNAAQAFIVDYLNQQEDGEGVAGSILKAGRAAGFTDNDLKNARKRCKDPRIVSRKASFGGGWVWSLEHDRSPQGVTDQPQGVEGVAPKCVDTLDTFDEKVTPWQAAPKPQTDEGRKTK